MFVNTMNPYKIHICPNCKETFRLKGTLLNHKGKCPLKPSRRLKKEDKLKDMIIPSPQTSKGSGGNPE